MGGVTGGGARDKGSCDDRFNALHDATSEDIRLARAGMALPPEAKFRGYVVFVPGTDDYLAEINHDGMVTKRAYAQSPDSAIRYSKRWVAERAARGARNDAVIGIVFDLGSQFRVAFGY